MSKIYNPLEAQDKLILNPCKKFSLMDLNQ